MPPGVRKKKQTIIMVAATLLFLTKYQSCRSNGLAVTALTNRQTDIQTNKHKGPIILPLP